MRVDDAADPITESTLGKTLYRAAHGYGRSSAIECYERRHLTQPVGAT